MPEPFELEPNQATWLRVLRIISTIGPLALGTIELFKKEKRVKQPPLVAPIPGPITSEPFKVNEVKDS